MNLAPAAREAVVERVLEARGRLIASARDDPRRAVWLADQAADLYFLLLPVEASGLTGLFGVPTPSQVARARRAAIGMHELASEARLEIERSLVALESAPGYARDVAAQIERRRLAEEERDRRIPFFGGIGAHLRAELDAAAGPQRLALEEEATGLLAPLSELLPPGLAAQARLYGGLALLGLGRIDEAAAGLSAVADDPAADPADAFAARLGLAEVAAARGGPAAGLTALDPIAREENGRLLHRLLLADVRFRLHRLRAEQAPPRSRADADRAAFEAYVDLLRGVPGSDPRTVHALVLARLAAVTGDDAPLERLPPVVTVARARHLAFEGNAPAEAVALLEGVLERRDLEPPDASEALYELGRALLAAGRPAEASARFAQLARDHAQEHVAERAIELAAEITSELLRARPDDAGARERFAETLDLLLSRYPNLESVDRWRFEAGRLAAAEGRFDEALALLAGIPPDAPQWLDAQVEQAQAALRRAESETDPALRSARHAEVLELVERLRPGVAGAGAGPVLSLAVCEAAAHMALGRPERALRSLQDLESLGTGAGEDLIALALFIRIDACGALDRPDDVARELDRLLAGAGGGAGRILSAMIDARRSAVEALLDEARGDEARALAGRHLIVVADAVDRWLPGAAAPEAERTGLRLAVADARRLAGRYDDAAAGYDELLRVHPDAMQPLLGKAECLFFQGQDLAGAMAIYRRIGSQTRPPSASFWQSQLRMLQILERTGRHTERIGPHIRQLREKDPDLGGERFRREFEALE